MRMPLLRGAIVVVALVFLGSCSATQTITLDENGSGDAEVHVSIDPVFAAYLTDLSRGMGGDDETSLFDVEVIRASLQAQPGVTVNHIEPDGPRDLRVEVGFESLEHLLQVQERAAHRFIRFERTESFLRLAAAIDRAALEQIGKIAGIDPFVAEALLPADDEMGPAEYRDYLGWAFEEYAEDRSMDTIFRESRVITAIDPSGSVVQIRGGESRNGTVQFVTPLVDAVTAQEPLTYSLVYTRE
ncbi:MAG: hypothetical protein ACOCYB_02335 [Alkalispirochaeta sp.]